MRGKLCSGVAATLTILLASAAGAAIETHSAAGSRDPFAPAAPLVVLYDQTDDPQGAGVFNITSQDFEAANDQFDAQAADDFVVPLGTWSIESVDVIGTYQGTGIAASFHVYFYADAAGLPGALLESRLLQPYTGAAGEASITLTPPVVLPVGTYWVSVQARQDFTPDGQWFWDNRATAAHSAAAWQNPGDGFGTGCTTWGVRTVCLDTQVGADQLFRLNGTQTLLPTILEVPALSTWGLAALSLLLVGAALLLLRRQG